MLVGAVAAALLGFACWLLEGWGGGAVLTMVSGAGSLIFAVLAFGCVVAAARTTSGCSRWTWAGIGIGLFGWIVADVSWALSYYLLHTQPAFPSFIDVAYLALPLSVCVVLAANAPAGSRFGGVLPFLDGLLVACALFLISWILVLKDVLAASTGSKLTFVVSLASPSLDTIMVTMGLVVVVGIPALLRRSVATLIVGLSIIAVTDGVVVYLRAHGQVCGVGAVIGWASGLFLIGVGALIAVDQPERLPAYRVQPSANKEWLPYVPMPIAILLGVHELWYSTDRVVLVVGVLLVFVALARQLTVLADNRHLVSTVTKQALRDPLTGLANRVLFADRITHAVRLRKRDGREVAVLSLDLDDFSLVNDNFGHASGDALLKTVADRLVSLLPGDAVARLGGDEFAILIEEGPRSPEELAQRVVEMFDKPFFLDGEEVYIHPSVGLACASSSPERTLSADELFRRAELAMISAKQAGVGGVQTYSHELHGSGETGPGIARTGRTTRAPTAGIRLVGQLRRAIDERELVLAYQPKVSLSNDRIVGVEALVRWPHPEFGLLTPNQFLPLVRQHGLMEVLTELVLSTAVTDAAEWYQRDTCDVPVAVNLFAPALNDLTLPDHIRTALAATRLPPTALSFELTEHLLLSNLDRAKAVIDQLRASGFRIAIDDFGSGYATMSYLRELPIDELKLDRQFIAPIVRSERSAAIVRSIIDLAHALGIVCVAEGVEDQATAERLRDYGCDIAQGHYFSRAVTAAQVELLCRNGLRDPATASGA